MVAKVNKKNIKLSTPEMVSDFINVCSKYDCDINVYDGSLVLDGKSIIGMFAIAQGKAVKVQAISSDKSVISSFVENMRKFEV